MEVYNYLELDKLDCTVAIIKNVQSKKMGRKDIIKIDQEIPLDLNLLAYIDHGITVNEEGYLSFENDDMSKLLAEGKTVKLLVLDNCDTVYTASATAREIFDPADLVTPEEEARQEKLQLAAKAGAIVAGAAAAVALLAGFARLVGKKKK